MKFKLKIIYYWISMLLTPHLKSRQAITVFQEKKLTKFSKRTLSKSGFYAKYFEGNSFHWSSVPEISRTEFMDHFDEINTLSISKTEAMRVALSSEASRNFKPEINGITVGLSTGTSGKRGLFLISEDERALWTALVMRRVIKPKFFRKQKVAFFLRANSNLYSSVASSLFAFEYFDIFKPFDELLVKLNGYQPSILAAQPCILADIAMAQKNNKISINPIQIISFAEVLHDADKDFIEKVFNVKITEVYQCTEGFLGVSCIQGTMHLNEDFIKVEKEWIDEEKFYPIITDFSRRSQPVVKYKMNDILQICKTPCNCGSPLLAIQKIIGRDDDILIFGKTKIYPDLIARRIAQRTDAFHKYTIIQTNNNCLDIGIECNAFDFEAIKKSFTIALHTLFQELDVKEVEFVFANKIEHTPGDKMRKIKRLNYEA